jgi:hypothetical protein
MGQLLRRWYLRGEKAMKGDAASVTSKRREGFSISMFLVLAQQNSQIIFVPGHVIGTG